ncbi:AAA family ATPase [Mycolicibacterium hodleri]|uniref:Uncharacterized protein n=1 Tax=Mycolicibacterium hodleri TaxID=49897 RepID=A0A502E8L7_9MYCO|nr:AAA family ATPase [Mycolicibacterium hodleri]TPG33787.1 hypothetical protein EAH80_16305 [Mycolicibacterium hodleri]
MRIGKVWVRFYKSFNFDYELKATPNAKRLPWQETSAGWMPHISIPLESDVTAIVGANESGKTHLLDAINIVLTGTGLEKRDFCRYSSLFSVEQQSRLYPEVGATMLLSESDSEAVRDLGIPVRNDGSIIMLRPEPGEIDVVGRDEERARLSSNQASGLTALLPFPHWLKTTVALPDSVSITALSGTASRITSRGQRLRLLGLLSGMGTEDQLVKNAGALLQLLDAQEASSPGDQLGQLLLSKVARIDTSSFQELEQAISNGRDGLVNGLIQEMNTSIARHLNISRWWTQDPDFQLRLSPRETELVFTIRDRTGTDYSFTERSRGLTYFLSYYVQLLSHDRPVDRTEVLLMDEPDAYLSASGQQDLLRVLEHHARPDNSERRDQVVYVTHSPFLVNRNAGHRVRVVDKGTRDEGTRLVKDATRNHYEPLRTSLGAYVAETAFIGGENLFVEGIADQVLLAGINARLLRAGAAPSRCLDLNRVTLVACGANVPYMLYLARGRDQIKPACAALLDSDTSGEEAKKQIKRGGAHGKPALSDDLVVMVADWAAREKISAEPGVVIREPEDLVPLSVAVNVARRYAENMVGAPETLTRTLEVSAVREALAEAQGSLWDALAATFRSIFETDMNKAGFAKELVALLDETETASSRPPGVPALDANFANLLEHLAKTLSMARERETERQRDHRLERIIDAFVCDHPTGCVRDTAASTLLRIDAAADDSTSGDVLRAETSRLRRDFKLAVDPLHNIDEYTDFLQRLKSLRLIERLDNQGLIEPAPRPRP